MLCEGFCQRGPEGVVQDMAFVRHMDLVATRYTMPAARLLDDVERRRAQPDNLAAAQVLALAADRHFIGLDGPGDLRLS